MVDRARSAKGGSTRSGRAFRLGIPEGVGIRCAAFYSYSRGYRTSLTELLPSFTLQPTVAIGGWVPRGAAHLCRDALPGRCEELVSSRKGRARAGSGVEG